jgi:hypothetical protein
MVSLIWLNWFLLISTWAKCWICSGSIDGGITCYKTTCDWGVLTAWLLVIFWWSSGMFTDQPCHWNSAKDGPLLGQPLIHLLDPPSFIGVLWSPWSPIGYKPRVFWSRHRGNPGCQDQLKGSLPKLEESAPGSKPTKSSGHQVVVTVEPEGC